MSNKEATVIKLREAKKVITTITRVSQADAKLSAKANAFKSKPTSCPCKISRPNSKKARVQSNTIIRVKSNSAVNKARMATVFRKIRVILDCYTLNITQLKISTYNN